MENNIINQSVFASLKELLGSNMGLLIDTYLSNSQEAMDSIWLAIESGNSAELYTHAHKLKSSTQQIGAQSLAELLISLEKAGKANQLENTAETFVKAKEIYEKVKQELQAL